ncbi:MAG: hypothetical protein ACXW1D_00175 [Halobacteriota archaeon]
MNYQGMLYIMKTVQHLYNTGEATSPYICDIVREDIEGEWDADEKDEICEDIAEYIGHMFSVRDWLNCKNGTYYYNNDQPVIDARKEMIATLIKRYEDALEAQQ